MGVLFSVQKLREEKGMNYSIDFSSFTTYQIVDRIKKTDLTPSLKPIKENAEEIAKGIHIEEELRILFRREIESRGKRYASHHS